MFVSADRFLSMLLLFRFVWIRGFLGAGKTLLSVALAHELMQRAVVRGVVSNLPTVLPPWIGEDDGTLYDRCIIFDEAWTQLDARNSFVNNTRDYGAYARKFRSFWMFPSVFQVDKRMRPLIVERAFRLPAFDLWVYRWFVETDYQSDDSMKGWFALKNPGRYFGMYDTAYVPVDDGGISGRHMRSVAKATKGYGVEYGDQLKDYLQGLIHAAYAQPVAEGLRVA